MNVLTGTLSINNVNILFDDGTTHGCPNTIRGRAWLESECTADIVKAVEAVWGDKPAVTEPAPLPQVTPQPTAEQKQLAAMALTQAQMTTTITALQQANAALMLKIAGGK